MTLCEPCGDMWMRWLDYRVRSRWIVGIGAGENCAARNREARAANTEAWASLIRRQQAGIVADCKRKHGAA